MCRKAGQKLSVLLRLSLYLDTNKKKTIYTTMVKSQLNYCPLVWMFCPRRSNNLINEVQERALRITYNDQLIDFKSLLSNHNETGKEKIVHVGYAKRTLENWATFSFPRSLCNIFFSFF